MEQPELLQTCFDLKLSLLRANHKLAQSKAALKLAKYNLREAKFAQLNYNGSFKSFRDKFTGKREESETTLRHAVQIAESEQTSAQCAVEALEKEIPELEKTISQLPSWETLRNTENEFLWCRLESLFCIESLIPLAETTHQLLLMRRNQFNGTYAGDIKSLQELSDIYSAPEAAGEACKPLLAQLQNALDFLDISFLIGAFFNNPTAFLSEATQYTRMDRINTAIVQTEELQRSLYKLQKELS